MLLSFVFLALLGVSQAHSLWPLPQQVASGGATETVNSNAFSFIATGVDSQILQDAFERYHAVIFPEVTRATGHLGAQILSLQVKVLTSSTSLQLGMDESYHLTLEGGAGVNALEAETVWGALRGLETFSQLVELDDQLGYVVRELPWTIVDSPRFPHRGILLDTSRNFLSVAAIKRNIDALSYTKMNVLHWHIVDSQSFPFESKSFPLLHQKGAYSSREIYTVQEIADIVQYGFNRGVRIIPEFDGPGHAYIWGIGYPNITACPDFRPWSNYCLQPPCGQLNPAVEETFTVLRGVLGDAADLFMDDFIHLGADEVNFPCWESNEVLTRWMEAQGYTSYVQVLQYYITRVSQIAHDLNKPAIFWQEVFNEGLEIPADTIIQVWLDSPTLKKIVSAGYRAILSNYQAWYLDCGFGNWLTGEDRSWCEPYKGWKTMYLNEPVPAGDGFDPSLVLGGEACMWGENTDSATVDSKVWPRAAAVGERLWSAKNVTDADAAFPRLDAHRERLLKRGIQASILRPKWCMLDADNCPES